MCLRFLDHLKTMYCTCFGRGAVREVSGTVEIEPYLRRAGVDMELCLAQRDDRSWI